MQREKRYRDCFIFAQRRGRGEHARILADSRLVACMFCCIAHSRFARSQHVRRFDRPAITPEAPLASLVHTASTTAHPVAPLPFLSHFPTSPISTWISTRPFIPQLSPPCPHQVPLRDDLQPTKAADEAADATSSSGGASSPSGELALAAVNDKSSSGPSDASTGGCASSASSGNTAAGSLSGTGLSAFRGDNAACSATTADTIATAFPNNAKEAQVETVERTEASCMSDEVRRIHTGARAHAHCYAGRAGCTVVDTCF